jgi:hypothetical protein
VIIWSFQRLEQWSYVVVAGGALTPIASMLLPDVSVVLRREFFENTPLATELPLLRTKIGFLGVVVLTLFSLSLFSLFFGAIRIPGSVDDSGKFREIIHARFYFYFAPNKQTNKQIMIK